METLQLLVPWERYVANRTTDGSQTAFDDMMSRHREPQRHYHTADHVVWVIRHLDSFTVDGIDHQLAAAAAFFHDAIYQPGAADNETASAELAERTLVSLGWAPDRATAVANLIRATADHLIDDRADGSDLTTAAFLAADLGVLAADPADYVEYTHRVRREYATLSDDEWTTGRARVLAQFEQRAAIYDARVVPADWEGRARANIAAELASLGG